MVPVPQESLMRWTAEDVRRMIDCGGFLHPERFELVEGLILDKMGQNEPHIVSILLLTRALRAVYDAYDLAPNVPLSLSDQNAPEPDLMAVKPGLLRRPTPEDVVCLCEVSDTSLRKDQTVKAALYARHGIPEYVILDVTSRRVEIRRVPNSETESWRETLILEEGGEFTPLGASGPIQVSDLFGDVE